jgi:hypothetical protein
MGVDTFGPGALHGGRVVLSPLISALIAVSLISPPYKYFLIPYA